MTDRCALLHPEGFYVYEKHCNFRNDDMTCSATEDDLITFKEFMTIRSSKPKARKDVD